MLGDFIYHLGLNESDFGVQSLINEEASLKVIPALDSNLRFFGGMGLGIALALLWITPKIELNSLLFRTLWLCAFLGGIGRLVSILIVGWPQLPMILFTFIELPLVPILIYWQWKVSKTK